MYIKRALEDKVRYLAEHFPVVMVCGARQVGKTTLLKKIAEENENIQYVTLDYPRVRQLAKEDPELFLQQYTEPVIIDEIQYAPELLPFIKIKVDEKDGNGRYYLTKNKDEVNYYKKKADNILSKSKRRRANQKLIFLFRYSSTW